MDAVLMFLGIGTGEIILIILIYVLLFGSRGLPELARQLGSLTRKIRKFIWYLEDNLRS